MEVLVMNADVGVKLCKMAGLVRVMYGMRLSVKVGG